MDNTASQQSHRIEDFDDVEVHVTGIMKNAIVTLSDEKERLYTVTTPGAIRFSHTVKADSEAEALTKVEDLLVMKTTEYAQKDKAIGGFRGHVDITPGSIR